VVLAPVAPPQPSFPSSPLLLRPPACPYPNHPASSPPPTPTPKAIATADRAASAPPQSPQLCPPSRSSPASRTSERVLARTQGSQSQLYLHSLSVRASRIHRCRNASRSAVHESGGTPSLTTCRHLPSTVGVLRTDISVHLGLPPLASDSRPK